MKYFFLVVAILLMLPAAVFAKVSNTNELITAMQKKYGKVVVQDCDVCSGDDKFST